MKYINPLDFDDDEVLMTLSDNRRLTSYDELKQHHLTILAAYDNYRNSGGNSHAITCINLPTTLGDKLRKHYDNPPSELGIFEEIRDRFSTDVCPMCGGFNPGTVDHVLPQRPFAEFAIFTKNLVPACKCNSKRQNTYIGSAGERVLHPYYDTFLKDRLIHAQFTGIFPNPNIDLEICYTGPNLAAVKFHVQNILLRTNMLHHWAQEWGKMLTKPHSKIGLEKTQILSRSELLSAIKKTVQRTDEDLDTPNNWKSMFFYGLFINPDAVDFLLQRLNQIVSGEISPDET